MVRERAPGKKGPGFEARWALAVYEPPGGYVTVLRLVTGRSQTKSVRGLAVRGYVRNTLNIRL